jgi:hypothetical protein
MTTRLSERRELAHRPNDGIEVTLFWSKASNRGQSRFSTLDPVPRSKFEVGGAEALDTFNHPYAYAAAWDGRHTATPHAVTSS